MTKVPERPPSYGEVLNGLYTAHRQRTRRKEQAKALRPRKHATDQHEYSQGEVLAHIDRLNERDEK